MRGKVISTAARVVSDVADGASLAVGGFGLCGVPYVLIEAIAEGAATGFKVFSNNCGVDGQGLGTLLSAGRIGRITASYIGENKEFARQYLAGELEVELTPQGTLVQGARPPSWSWSTRTATASRRSWSGVDGQRRHTERRYGHVPGASVLPTAVGKTIRGSDSPQTNALRKRPAPAGTSPDARKPY
jgi:hypothetical protein